MRNDLLSAVWASSESAPTWSNAEWETLLGQARNASLLARLALHHWDHGWLPRVPAGPRTHLNAGMRLAERQQHEVRWEVDRIKRALKDIRTPVVLLKGAAYLMGNLPPARGRLFADIDILVARDRIEAAETALFAAGWICDERDAYNQRYYRQWMHEIPPLRHVQRNTFIDLHHTIAPPTSRFHVDGRALLSRIEPLEGHAGLYVLAAPDMVLHSAVHLFQEGEFDRGLRDLLDLLDLIRHFEQRPDFWRNLVDRARELGLQLPLSHALRHLNRLFAYSPPDSVSADIHAMHPTFIRRHALDWALSLALQPVHPSCDSGSNSVARWLLYVRSHALRMPIHLLVPHLLRKAYLRRFAGEKEPTNA